MGSNSISSKPTNISINNFNAPKYNASTIKNNIGSTISDNDIYYDDGYGVEDYDYTIPEKSYQGIQNTYDIINNTLKDLEIYDEGKIKVDDWNEEGYPNLRRKGDRLLTPEEYLMEVNGASSTAAMNAGIINEPNKQALIEAYAKQYSECFKSIKGITYEEYKTMEADISFLGVTNYEYKQLVKEIPYLKMAETEEFIDYKNTNQENIDEIFKGYRYESHDGTYASVMSAHPETTIKVDTLSGIGDYLTEEQKLMYCYLCSKEGINSAEAYLTAIEDKINQAKAKAAIEAYYRSNSDLPDDVSIFDENGQFKPDVLKKYKLDSDSVLTYLDTLATGLENGVTSFNEGILKMLETEGTITANDYQIVFMQQILNEYNGLNDVYQISEGVGEILVPVVIGMLASAAAPELVPELATVSGTLAEGGAVINSVTMYAKAINTMMIAASNFGKGKNDSLVAGNSFEQATIYGILKGCSSAVLNYFFANIPGVSAESSSELRKILMAGAQKATNTIIYTAADQIINDYNTTDITTLGEDVFLDFITGMTASMLSNYGQITQNIICNGEKITIQTFDDLYDVIETYEEVNNTELS